MNTIQFVQDNCCKKDQLFQTITRHPCPELITAHAVMQLAAHRYWFRIAAAAGYGSCGAVSSCESRLQRPGTALSPEMKAM